MRRLLAVVAIVPVALAVAGCSKKIDTDKAERSIKAGLESKTGGRVSIASVTCPDDIDVEKGKRFDCTVKGTNGRTGTVTVVQTDNKGSVTYSGNLAALAGR
jgi:Domain of unknown function (DUF4333)